MIRYNFEEPKNIKECKARLLILRFTLQDIELQLADPERRDKDGIVLQGQDYKRWRYRALSKLNAVRAEHAYLTDWLVDARIKAQAQSLGVDDHSDPKGLIMRGRDVLRQLADYSADAGKLSDVFDHYLLHLG